MEVKKKTISEDLRSEFTVKKFFPIIDEYDSWNNIFGESSFKIKNKIFLILRILNFILMFTFFIINIIHNKGNNHYLIYLTHWTFVIIFIYIFFVIFSTIFAQKTKEQSSKVPWFEKIILILQAISVTGSITVTLLYWLLEFDGRFQFSSLLPHGLQMIPVLIDNIISRHDMYIYHFIYPMVYGIIYTIWTAIFFGANLTDQYGNKYVYAAIDYGGNPAGASVYAILTPFLFVPILHIFMWFLIFFPKRRLMK
eukprot:GHVL01019342.1.p1 GENE.GHVL01019342.1~~GHVL01019342.1.p1  ORF type:complete len:253 (+),score=42.97 GHVL01019342.1:22-780(+)